MNHLIKIVALFLSSFLFAQDNCSDCGTYAGNWLQLETGTRAIGMAGAHVATGDGVYAAPYNPSAISYIEDSDMFFSNTNYVADISHHVIGYATQLDQNNFIGLHIFHMNSGDIEVTTIDEPNGLGEFYSVKATSIRGIYARKLLQERLNIGFSAKYIRENIHTVYMQSFLLDMGASFHLAYGTTLGLSLSNFGSDVQFHGPGLQVLDESSPSGSYQQITQPHSVPLSFRFGVKSNIVGESMGNSIFPTATGSTLIFALDGVYSQDDKFYSTMGCEFSWKKIAFVRLGTHLGHDTAGFSAGAGLVYNKIAVDVAYVHYGDLNLDHGTVQYGLRVGF